MVMDPTHGSGFIIFLHKKAKKKKHETLPTHSRRNRTILARLFFIPLLAETERVPNPVMKATKRPIQAVATWVRRQPPKIKAFLAVVSGMAALVFLRFVVHDHDNLFVAAEAVHAIGISVLIYKLMKERTCAGLAVAFFYYYYYYLFLFNHCCLTLFFIVFKCGIRFRVLICSCFL